MEKSKLKTQVSTSSIIFSILGFVIFIFSFYYLLVGFPKTKSSEISPDQIKMQKGDKIVIVNENGVIEYYSESGTYYDYWDQGRTKSFFDHIKQVAREYLANPSSTTDDKSGYYITLYIDGEEVEIWVSDEDEIINEVFSDNPSGDGGGGSLDEYFDDYFNLSPTGIGGGSDMGSLTPTLVPGSGVVSAEDGDDVPSGGIGGSGQQIPADCSLFEASVTGRTIISNALCVDPEKTGE